MARPIDDTEASPIDQPRRYPYQPSLDGVRAIAVLAVVLFHFEVGGFDGGFLGVDVFLALSGFLITTLLLREFAETKRIRIGAFYGRRVRRLLPALFLVIAAVAFFGQYAADEFQLEHLRGDAISSIFYVANWRFIGTGGGYFEQFLSPSPLRHLWSLAIEEQWYLVWPLVVFAGVALVGLPVGRRRWGWVAFTVAGAVVSAGLMALLLDEENVNRVYYGTDTRAQALLIGTVLAVLVHARQLTPRAQRIVDALGVVGLAGCVAMFVGVDATDTWMYRGGFALDRGARHDDDRRCRVAGEGDHADDPLGAAAPGAGSHLVRRVPLALAGVRLPGRGAHGPRRSGALRRPLRRHDPGLARVVRPRRATDPRTSVAQGRRRRPRRRGVRRGRRARRRAHPRRTRTDHGRGDHRPGRRRERRAGARRGRLGRLQHRLLEPPEARRRADHGDRHDDVGLRDPGARRHAVLERVLRLAQGHRDVRSRGHRARARTLGDAGPGHRWSVVPGRLVALGQGAATGARPRPGDPHREGRSRRGAQRTFVLPRAGRRPPLQRRERRLAQPDLRRGRREARAARGGRRLRRVPVPRRTHDADGARPDGGRRGAPRARRARRPCGSGSPRSRSSPAPP